LKLYYGQHLSDYRVPERVKVAHILLKTSAKNPAEVSTIEKTAHDLLAQIKSGANFGELAKQHSEDTANAQNGGELGWIVRKQTVPDFGNGEAFANLAFQLRQADVGEPISVPKGLAVIQVAEIVPEHVPALDEVRAQVEQDYRATKSRELASGKAKAFAAQAK